MENELDTNSLKTNLNYPFILEIMFKRNEDCLHSATR